MPPSKKKVLSPYVILTLSARGRKNVIIHGPNGDILYWIETSTGPTFVYRASPFPSLTDEGAQERPGVEVSKQQIAKFDFKVFQKSMITYDGTEQEVAEFLPRKHSWRGVYRRAQTPIGQLKWAPGKLRPHLVNDSRQLLALYSTNRRLFKRSNATIHVNEQCVPFLDLIVLGWIIELRDAENGEGTQTASDGVGLVTGVVPNATGAG